MRVFDLYKSVLFDIYVVLLSYLTYTNTKCNIYSFSGSFSFLSLQVHIRIYLCKMLSTSFMMNLLLIGYRH